MRISEYQLWVLIEIAKGSMNFTDSIGGISFDQRHRLLNEIIKQQNHVAIELDAFLPKSVPEDGEKNYRG